MVVNVILISENGNQTRENMWNIILGKTFTLLFWIILKSFYFDIIISRNWPKSVKA